MISNNNLADLLDRLVPLLDWNKNDNASTLQKRLIEITKVLNDFSREVNKGELNVR